jgi:hypothetical protein
MSKVSIYLPDLDPSLPAVRRLIALTLYRAGAPVKVIEGDTGVRLNTLARLARTYGIPQRRKVQR